MSKKVVRLTESQLRLMINKVINEQKAPISNPTTAQTNPNDKQKVIEALTKMNTPAYVSKFHPGYILQPHNDLQFFDRSHKWSLTVSAFSVVDKMVGGYVIFTYYIDSTQSLESATLQEIMEGINSGELNVRIDKQNNEIIDIKRLYKGIQYPIIRSIPSSIIGFYIYEYMLEYMK